MLAGSPAAERAARRGRSAHRLAHTKPPSAQQRSPCAKQAPDVAHPAERAEPLVAVSARAVGAQLRLVWPALGVCPVGSLEAAISLRLAATVASVAAAVRICRGRADIGRWRGIFWHLVHPRSRAEPLGGVGASAVLVGLRGEAAALGVVAVGPLEAAVVVALAAPALVARREVLLVRGAVPGVVGGGRGHQ
eukprot:807589-Prymnesium_polylepis.1